MKLVIEVPCLEGQLAEALARFEPQKGWDGIALAGRTLTGAEDWEDLVEAANARWLLLDRLLPENITSQLPELNQAAREKVLEHARKLIERTASFKLSHVALDLAVERLAWTPTGEAGLETRLEILTALLPAAERLGCKLCIPLRQPLPSPIRKAADLTLKLLAELKQPGCGLLLNVVVDELADRAPAALLAPFMETLEVLRLQYEPGLGLRPEAQMQPEWPAYLREQKFGGLVVWAPGVGDVGQFERELARLTPQLRQYWR